MAAVQKPVVLLIFKGGREVKKVEGARQIFDGVVQIGGGLGIFANHQVIQLARRIMLKYSADEKGGRAALQIFTPDPLGLGQQKLLRQLKKAGRM
jgi:hypothetical protein